MALAPRNPHCPTPPPRPVRPGPGNGAWALLGLVGILLLCAACSSGASQESGTTVVRPAITRVRVRAAGATFPYEIYSRWAFQYASKVGLSLQYEQVGSVEGLRAVSEGRVDFGTSDIPLTSAQLEEQNLVQFPLIIGAVTPVVHLPGLAPGDLVVTPQLLASIFSGRIRRWNDPAIAALNPDLALPDREIVVVYRSDESGTTWLFSRFLCGCSESWWGEIGMGSTLSWPVGVGGKGNDQVARFVEQFEYTIGYVEFSYAVDRNLSWVAFRSDQGERILPDRHTLVAAAEASRWDPAGRLVIDTGLVEGIWPVSGPSYVMMRRRQENVQRARAVLDFFFWALREGDQIARVHRFAPIPDRHLHHIYRQWSRIRSIQGIEVWQPDPPPAPDTANPAASEPAPQAGDHLPLGIPHLLDEAGPSRSDSERPREPTRQP